MNTYSEGASRSGGAKKEVKSMRQRNTNAIKQRVGILMLAFLLCLAGLTGCGKDSKNKTDNTVTAAPTATATSTATPTSTPSPTPTPEPWESYEKVGERAVYRVPGAEFGYGAQIAGSKSAGEYLLLQVWGDDPGIPGPEWGRLMLLRPALSGEAAVMNPTFPVRYFRVLADGTVVLAESLTGTIHVYDNKWSETKSFAPEEGKAEVLDVTENGRIWLKNEEKGRLSICDLTGENAASYDVGTDLSVYQSLGGNGGKQYFCATVDPDGSAHDLILCVDTAAGTVSRIEEWMVNVSLGIEAYNCSTSGNIPYYPSEETWYLHLLAGNGHWVAFPQKHQYERIEASNGDRMCISGVLRGTEDSEMRETGNSGYMWIMPRGCRVLDLAERKILAEITTHELNGYESMEAVGMQENGTVILQAGKPDGSTSILVWDIRGEKAEPIRGFYDLTEETTAVCVTKLWDEYREEYGISYKSSPLKVVGKDEQIELLQEMDFANMLARSVAANPAEFPKDADGIALHLENVHGHERGHAQFNPHYVPEQAKAYYGEKLEKAFYNLVDAMRAGEDRYDCEDRFAYNFSVSFFASWYYPVASACTTTSYDVRDKKSYVDGRGVIPYTVPLEEAAELMKEFEQLVCDVLDDAIADDYTDFEKALALYEYMTEYWAYDYEMYAHMDDINYWGKGSIYRCLHDRTGICWEIAGVYNYLLGQLGVKAEEISGTCPSDDHAWTYITLDGVGYFVDPTWGLTTDRTPTLAYFLMTEKLRAERDEFDPDKNTLYGLSEDNYREFGCAADDERYKALWDGRYVGMDRVAKKVIYLDANDVMHTFSYGE